jgi:hypothetical protein
MATLVPTIGEGLSRGSRRHEQHNRSDPGGESLSPLVPGGERQHERAPRGGPRDGHAHQQLQIGPGSCAGSFAAQPVPTMAAEVAKTWVPRWVWRRKCQRVSTGLNAGKEDGGWRRRIAPGIRGFSPVWGPPAPSRSKSSTSSDGVTALRRLAADLFARQVHGMGVGIRQDHGRADIAARPPSAAYRGPFAALIARGGESAAAPGQGHMERGLV